MMNLRELDTLDLTHPWWDGSILDAFDFVEGRSYMVNGDINYLDDYGIVCLYFNKTLFDRYNIAYPYDEVKNGFISNGSIGANMLAGFNAMSVSKNADGKFAFTLTEDYFDKFALIIDKFCNTESTVIVERKFGYDVGKKYSITATHYLWIT